LLILLLVLSFRADALSRLVFAGVFGVRLERRQQRLLDLISFWVLEKKLESSNYEQKLGHKLVATIVF
jgi:hypothetical protein